MWLGFAVSAATEQSGPEPSTGEIVKILYVFPHPDDESFGPALAISAQRRQGHEVHLLTLTRGGATKQRHRYGYSIEEMGEVRRREMEEVAEVLGLNGLTVLDLPDGGLKEMDPITIEAVVREEVERLRPDVLVTYAVHGVSGFHDHLVSHAVVKRVFCALRAEGAEHPRRLALFTLAESPVPDGPFTLSTSTPEEIDCAVPVSEHDLETARRALACYETYAEVIERADPLARVGDTVYFEIFQESHDPPLESLFAGVSSR